MKKIVRQPPHFKISQEHAKDLWQKLGSQAKKSSEEKEKEKINKILALSQKEKNRLLFCAASAFDINKFKEALKGGAELDHNLYIYGMSGKNPFYLLGDFSPPFIQAMFDYGLKDKIRDANKMWKELFKTRKTPTFFFEMLIKNELYCTDMNIFKKYKDHEEFARWWEKKGIWEFPEQVRSLGPDKVFTEALNGYLHKEDSDFYIQTINQIKINYPTNFENLKTPSHAGELWSKSFNFKSNTIGFLCHLIDLDIIPPLRYKSISSQPKKNLLSWPWLALRANKEELFNFFMKSEEMREIFKEDTQNQPDLTVFCTGLYNLYFDQGSFSSILKKNGFDFTIVDKNKNNFMHHFLSRSGQIEIDKELHEVVEENIAFFFKSKNTKKQTIFDIKTSGETSKTIKVKGKSISLDEYKIELEKKYLEKSLSPSIKSVIKKARL